MSERNRFPTRTKRNGREGQYIVTFFSVHMALFFEKKAKELGINVRVVPVPRRISAACGLACRINGEDLADLQTVCKREGIEIEHIYRQRPESMEKIY